MSGAAAGCGGMDGSFQMTVGATTGYRARRISMAEWEGQGMNKPKWNSSSTMLRTLDNKTAPSWKGQNETAYHHIQLAQNKRHEDQKRIRYAHFKTPQFTSWKKDVDYIEGQQTFQHRADQTAQIIAETRYVCFFRGLYKPKIGDTYVSCV